MSSADLTLDDYRTQARATAMYPVLGAIPVYPVLGLTGEYGEVASLYLPGEDDIPVEELHKEAGDVLWYIANEVHDLGLTMVSLVDGCTTFAELQDHVLNNEDICSVLLEDEDGIDDSDEDQADQICEATAIAVLELGVAVGRVAELTKKALRDDGGTLKDARLHDLKEALSRVLVCLTIVVVLAELDLGGIAQANLDKLASRKARGTIQGSGNER